MKVFIVSAVSDYDHGEIIGVFQTLKGAIDFVESLDDSIPFESDHYDEYDPKNLVKGYWVDGFSYYITENQVSE